MSEHGTVIVDRIAEYRVRCAACRNYDWLGFYIRAEFGRKWLLSFAKFNARPRVGLSTSLPSRVQAGDGVGTPSNVLRLKRRRA